ncbi:aspartate kinase [Candidatus Dojkabacteria bacterium]|uniref:Aspartate kinase n=1 Tax=Candidatus Dojkabacteria bacterium TaxID=2099670 RepID=A0A955L5G6_9BACT|nr:aspartate kinase [Candidatus Dojkabacteria bacterium]
MVSVPEVVEQIINNMPFVEDALAKGLVNTSALAREIQPQVIEILSKDVQEGAIVMALNRNKSEFTKTDKSIQSILDKLADITVKSNIVEVTIKNSHDTLNKIRQLLERIEAKPDRFIAITQGVAEVTIITTKNNLTDIEEIIVSDEIILKQIDLSSITVKLPPENVEVPGVYYQILKKIAWKGINIIDTVSTTNEITIVFSQDDIEQAFSIIKGL